jgi:hypothetical protein
MGQVHLEDRQKTLGSRVREKTLGSRVRGKTFGSRAEQLSSQVELVSCGETVEWGSLC